MTPAAIWSLLLFSVLLVWLAWIWWWHQKLPTRAAVTTRVRRLRPEGTRPRTPDDCPACRQAPGAPPHAISASVRHTSATTAPYSVVRGGGGEK
jgi:hypothetical protein